MVIAIDVDEVYIFVMKEIGQDPINVEDFALNKTWIKKFDASSLVLPAAWVDESPMRLRCRRKAHALKIDEWLVRCVSGVRI